VNFDLTFGLTLDSTRPSAPVTKKSMRIPSGFISEKSRNILAAGGYVCSTTSNEVVATDTDIVYFRLVPTESALCDF
jgi:hypothetical protein